MKKLSTLLKEVKGTTSVWYHGSNKPIKKFLFSKIGHNEKRTISSHYGYGIYFTPYEEKAKSYGQSVTKVTIDPKADILKDRVTPKQLKKVYQQFLKENMEISEEDRQWFLNPTYEKGSILNDILEFYDYFLRAYRRHFKDDIKNISIFLAKSGIDGMQVTDDMNEDILVVFNEDIIHIVSGNA